MINQYVRAYRDCSEWLAQVFLPWRWIIVLHEEIHTVRELAVAGHDE